MRSRVSMDNEMAGERMVPKELQNDALVLAVKIANSETALGLFSGSELLGSWKTATVAQSTANDLEHAAMAFLDTRDLPDPQDAIVCSVVPGLTSRWQEALSALTNRRPLVVGPGLKSGIAMDYKDPGQLGADRVVCAVAAKELYGCPVAVVDFEACTAISVVGEAGSFVGGVILPGFHVGMEALRDSAVQLSEVHIQVPHQVVGRTTADALRSGFVLGEAARIDGLIDAIWDELGYRTALVTTGANPSVLASLRHDFVECPDLALRGMRIIYGLNR